MKELFSGVVELQHDEEGRPFVNIPAPPGYKFVTKDGMPVDGWQCKEPKWDESGDGFSLELPDGITIVKEVN
jgi:hypothetical protein